MCDAFAISANEATVIPESDTCECKAGTQVKAYDGIYRIWGSERQEFVEVDYAIDDVTNVVYSRIKVVIVTLKNNSSNKGSESFLDDYFDANNDSDPLYFDYIYYIFTLMTLKQIRPEPDLF